MGKPVTPEEVIKLMHSVFRISVDLYPNSYKTDAKFINVLKPELRKRGLNIKKKLLNFEMSYDDIIKCIGTAYDMQNYISEFHNTFKINDGIGKNYDALLSKYTAIEIVLLYNLYPNMVYVDFTVHNGKTDYPNMEKLVTAFRLPDIKIKTVSLRLRNYAEQNTVDLINKFIIKTGQFPNDAMSKRNIFMVNHVTDFMMILEEICKQNNYDPALAELIQQISFMDINEISDVAVLVITDWPIL